MKLKNILNRFFEHIDLWELTVEELEEKKKKTVQDCKISWGNSLIMAFASIGMFYYGFQHVSIILMFSVVLFILLYCKEVEKLERIDFIIHMKKYYEV